MANVVEEDAGGRAALTAAGRTFRRAALPTILFGLMMASLLVGRLEVHSNSLPEFVRTLPGDEPQFSHELDAWIRNRFPVGSSEDKLLEFLSREQFSPQWRRRDDPNEAVFVHRGLICAQTVQISWRADTAGILTEIHGNYQDSCVSDSGNAG